jgi:hypothetical protein
MVSSLPFLSCTLYHQRVSIFTISTSLSLIPGLRTARKVDCIAFSAFLLPQYLHLLTRRVHSNVSEQLLVLLQHHHA